MAWTVEPRKLTNYLLSDATPESSGKRQFFMAIGFSAARADQLGAALLAHKDTARLEYEDEASPYGRKRIFRCALPEAPNGKVYCVRTVWQLRGDTWRLLTAYPQTEL